MAFLFDAGIFSVEGLSGEILPGTKLYWYESGTSTPLATYSNEALTTPNANPVLSDSEGRFPSIWLQDASYKLVMELPNGTQRTRDPIRNPGDGVFVPYTDLASTDPASSGAGSVGYIAAGVGAVGRTLQDKGRDSLSVADFGVKGNPLLNERSLLIAAMSAAAALGKPLDLLGMTIHAEGAAIPCNCSINGAGATIYGRLEAGSSNLHWKDITVRSESAVYAIYLHGRSDGRYKNIHLENVRTGFENPSTPESRLGLSATYIDGLQITGGYYEYGANLVNCVNYAVIGATFDGDDFQNRAELLQMTVRTTGIVTGCTFLNSGDNWIDLYSSGEKNVIVGNRFIGCKPFLGTGIEIKCSMSDDPLNTSGAALGFDKSIIIAMNYFSGLAAPSNIFISYISAYYIDSRAAPAFSWAEVPTHIKIVDNIFDGVDGSLLTSAQFSCLYLDKIGNFDVSGNDFTGMDPGTSASEWSSLIWIDGCRGGTVARNKGAMRYGCGITFHATCSDITVSDNQVLTDLTYGFTSKYGITAQKIGSRPDPTLNNVDFIANKLDGTSHAFRFPRYAAGGLTRCKFSLNDARNYSIIEKISKSKINDNDFTGKVDSGGILALGITSEITFGNDVRGNSFHGVVEQALNVVVTRMRVSRIQDNTAYNTNEGLWFIGSNVDGEMDYLTIKNNTSVAQVGVNFPRYSNMTANDITTRVVDNNVKVAT